MHRTFVALDFETANNDRTSVCAIGLVRVEHGEIVARRMVLVRPPTTDFRHARVHGIRAVDVARSPAFPDAWASILPLFRGASCIAAHSAPFERGVLAHCAERWRIGKPTAPFLCTMMLARQVWNVRPTTLPDVARRLGIALVHHDALSDAEASARIVLAATSSKRHALSVG